MELEAVYKPSAACKVPGTQVENAKPLKEFVKNARILLAANKLKECQICCCGKFGHCRNCRAACPGDYRTREQHHHFKSEYGSARHRSSADVLSRRPCGDNKHCKRVEEPEHTVNARTELTAENVRVSQQQDKDIGLLLHWKEENSPRL